LVYRAFALQIVDSQEQSFSSVTTSGAADESGCYIVQFNEIKEKLSAAESFARSIVTSGMKAAGGKIKRLFQHAFNGFSICGITDDSLIKKFKSNRVVKAIAKDRIVNLQAIQKTNPYFWGLDRIDDRTFDFDNTYEFNSSTTGPYIFIVDSGVLTTHDEFNRNGSRIIPGFNYFNDGVDDCQGHGTHVAGTGAGYFAGANKFAKIVPVRVFQCSGSTTLSAIIAGIEYVISRTDLRPAVMSMSLGVEGYDPNFDQAVKNAISQGIVVVAAAGNDNKDACTFYPASTTGVISVGSTSYTGTASPYTDIKSSFSNYGQCVSIFAPGSNILSASISGNSLYEYQSGTSMAAPLVSGIASLYLAKFPQATPAQVKEAIVNQYSTLNAIFNISSTGSPNKLLYSNFNSIARDLTIYTTPSPTTPSPTTKAPTTGVPTTKAPTTASPTTKSPTTQAPTISNDFIIISTYNNLILEQQKSTNLYFINNGTFRYSLIYNESQLSSLSYGKNIRPIGITVLGQKNQMLFIKSDTNEVLTWNLTKNWIFESSGESFPVNSPEALLLEKQFNVDTNKDGYIGENSPVIAKTENSSSTGLVAGISGGVVAIIAILGISIYYFKRRKSLDTTDAGNIHQKAMPLRPRNDAENKPNPNPNPRRPLPKF
jgi:cell division septation protein DedD